MSFSASTPNTQWISMNHLFYEKQDHVKKVCGYMSDGVLFVLVLVGTLVVIGGVIWLWVKTCKRFSSAAFFNKTSLLLCISGAVFFGCSVFCFVEPDILQEKLNISESISEVIGVISAIIGSALWIWLTVRNFIMYHTWAIFISLSHYVIGASVALVSVALIYTIVGLAVLAIALLFLGVANKSDTDNAYIWEEGEYGRTPITVMYDKNGRVLPVSGNYLIDGDVRHEIVKRNSDGTYEDRYGNIYRK